MINLFCYGTLRHLPLLQIVLGRAPDDLDARPAQLPGYAVSAVAEGPFPTIEARDGASAEGIVVAGLSARDIERLDFYEGAFDYDLAAVTLADGSQAQVYLPQPGRWTAQGPWVLADWADDWGEISCHAAHEVMGYLGHKSRDAVDAMFPMIRARAASKVNAAHSRHGAGTKQGKVEVIESTRSYANFFALDDMRLRHERFDGAMSAEVLRAVFIAADAALVLPYDPVRDRVLLVEQFRMGPLARGDRACWQLEPIAGRMDAGETPQETARREAREEAGITLGALERVAEVYASPGNSTEFYHIFVGLADLPDSAAGMGGLDSEDEDIRSHVIGFDALMDLVDGLHAANAPLVLAAYWLARHRERLRLAGAGATPVSV
tara:strand:+ start:11101 stop:12234 length:1134 start_codon:yes stop_codon:yes gene_type:complete